MSLYKGTRRQRAKHRPNTNAVDSRAVILGGLEAVRLGHNLPDGLAQAGLATLSPRDRAFARRLAMHAVRHKRRLEAQMSALLQRPTRDGGISDLLLLGAAQIDMADVADHAAVNSTVELAPTRLRGLVNAILRRRLREEPAAPASAAERLSYPDWLYQAIRKDWGSQSDAILEALNTDPPLCLRINPQHHQRDSYLTLLQEAGASATALGEDGLALEQSTAVTELPGYEQGAVSVQGPAAQFAAGLMNLAPELWVLDACAAPGGKTAHMLEREPKIQCVAVDNDGQRLARVAENLERVGATAQLHTGDVAGRGSWVRPYQRILLDAPCSGTGVIARHPDIKWLRRESDIEALCAQQLSLLEACWSMLESGGQLLYCTCSILSAENDGVVAAFLKTHPDAQAESIKLPVGQASTHGWRIAPDSPYEGFYYARLLKA